MWWECIALLQKILRVRTSQSSYKKINNAILSFGRPQSPFQCTMCIHTHKCVCACERALTISRSPFSQQVRTTHACPYIYALWRVPSALYTIGYRVVQKRKHHPDFCSKQIAIWNCYFYHQFEKMSAWCRIKYAILFSKSHLRKRKMANVHCSHPPPWPEKIESFTFVFVYYFEFLFLFESPKCWCQNLDVIAFFVTRDAKQVIFFNQKSLDRKQKCGICFFTTTYWTLYA